MTKNADLLFVQTNESAVRDVSIVKAGGTLLLSVVEAVCVFFVVSAKAGFLLVSASIAAGVWGSVFHQDWIRLPLLGIAVTGSLYNLYLLWNAHNLRNAPGAAWRKRQLSAKDRWRTAIVFTFSIATILLAFVEVYLHRTLHHTAL